MPCRDRLRQITDEVGLLGGKLIFQTQDFLHHSFLLVLQGLDEVEHKFGLFHGLLPHVCDVTSETLIALT